MASMTLFVASSLKSVTVHANNNYYPKTFGPGTHTLSNLPSSGNIWIVPANDVTFASGYGSPVNVTTQNPSDSWKLDNDNYIAIKNGRSITLTGTQGGSSGSYDVKVVLGSGIKQVGFGVNTTAVSNLASADFTVDVGAGGRMYINIARYEDGYTYPVIATPSSGSAWTVVNANGVYNDHYISAPSSPGTRTVTLTATYAPTYYYQMHADANGGQFADGTTAWASSVLSTRGSGGVVNYDVSNFPTPIWGGYAFVGWGSSAGATTTYDGTVSFVTNATSSSSPKSVTVYAVWKRTEYTCYIKLGAGINSASIYVDGVLKSDIRDKVYHAISVRYDSTITVKSIAKATGYGRPYTFNFYQNSTATTPTATLVRDMDEPYYGYSTARFYAEIVASKSNIGLFYWNNSAWDAANIKKGQPISNLTAARWNRFKAKIAELAEAEGGSYSYSTVASGNTFYATEFNSVRTAIMNRSGYGTLPAAQSSGNSVKAAMFEGNGSLKTALNAAITHYNNS